MFVSYLNQKFAKENPEDTEYSFVSYSNLNYPATAGLLAS